MSGKIDYIFIGAGTGGTITGIAKYMKEKNKDIKIVGIDPVGSVLSYPDSMNTVEQMYKIEGIGQSEIPGVLERKYVDHWIKTEDKTSF